MSTQEATKRLALLALALIALPASPAVAMARDASTTTCAEPVVTREYTTEVMSYRLSIDLHGCDWWDGTPLTLVAFLTRDDGQTEEGAFSPMACMGVVGNKEDPKARPDVVGCEVSVSVEHPAVEVAHYVGAVSYLWQDGPRNASFDTTCMSSAAGAVCRDDYAPAVRGPGVHT